MKRKNFIVTFVVGIALAYPLLAQAEPNWRAEAIAMMQRDFQTRGQAVYERLQEDELQAV